MSKSITGDLSTKNRELIFARKGNSWIGAIVFLDHGQLTSEDYASLYKQFADQQRLNPADVSLETLHSDQSRGHIYWTESVALGGCRFTLLALPMATESQIAELRTEIKRARDVVSLTTIRIRLLVLFDYKPK